jgi:urease accessory protein
VALAALFLAPSALAHHVMGGELPNMAWQGLLSGLGHPIIGFDHFAFIVGVGLMSHLAGRIVLLPLLFVVGTVIGCGAHLQGLDLPSPELVIALTLAAAAGIVAVRLRVPAAVAGILFVAVGVFHGYAYGESIVGAETTPLAAYVVGFALIQYTVAVASALALRHLVARAYLAEATASRLAGGAMALVAAVALVSTVVAA